MTDSLEDNHLPGSAAVETTCCALRVCGATMTAEVNGSKAVVFFSLIVGVSNDLVRKHNAFSAVRFIERFPVERITRRLSAGRYASAELKVL